MAVMPSDHVIDPTKSFQRALLQAKDLVDKNPDRLVTFGIRPSTPSSSYGYIQQAEPWPTKRMMHRFTESLNSERSHLLM